MFRVMIVDDMEFIRLQIKRLPIWGELTGFEIVDEAEDGQEALDKLHIQSVDLLITDIRMPRVNGIELLREVHENQLAACVVFLSEYGEFELAKEAIQYGIFDYLIKPVNTVELTRLLEKVKEFINTEAEAQVQVKKLEAKLAEKIEVYYPENQIVTVLQYISEGSEKAIAASSAMVDDTAAALDYDIIKAKIVLQKTCNEICAGTIANHKWIEQFIDTKLYIETSFKHIDNFDSLKEMVVEKLKELLSIIKRFIFDSHKNPLIREICLYIIANVEKEINISKISAALFLTKNYLGDVFKKETDMTLGDYITMIKLERAKRLVLEGSLKHYEIAQVLGYNNVEYFGKLFKRYTGFSPMEFKNMFRNK